MKYFQKTLVTHALFNCVLMTELRQIPWDSRFLVAFLAHHQENLEQKLWFSYAELNLESVLSVILALGYDSFFVTDSFFS